MTDERFELGVKSLFILISYVWCEQLVHLHLPNDVSGIAVLLQGA